MKITILDTTGATPSEVGAFTCQTATVCRLELIVLCPDKGQRREALGLLLDSEITVEKDAKLPERLVIDLDSTDYEFCFHAE